MARIIESAVWVAPVGSTIVSFDWIDERLIAVFLDDGGRRVEGKVSFDTNAQAWRWVDRFEGDPISRSEAVSEWVFKQE